MEGIKSEKITKNIQINFHVKLYPLQVT